MKKLMFALGAAALCGVVFADVTSANIVGYAPTALPTDGEGLSVGAAFLPMGAEKVDLQTVSVVGYEKEVGTLGDVQVQTLTAGGSTDRTFMWIDFKDESEGIEMTPGWYDSDNDYAPLEKGEITVYPGEGLWSVTMIDGLSIQSSGEVPTVNDIAVPLPTDGEGLTIANPTPVTVDLMNCYVTGYDKDAGTLGDVQVQTLTAGGSTDRTFMWIDFKDESEGIEMAPGWYDSDNDYAPLEENEVTTIAGEGLWTVTMVSDLYFCWPKVEIGE